MLYDYSREIASHDQYQKPVQGRWYKRWWGILIIILFLFSVIASIAMGLYILKLARQIRAERVDTLRTPNSVENQISSVPELQNEIVTDRGFQGAQFPKITIQEYIDYECPDCQKSDIIIDQLLADPIYQKTVRIEYYHFPIVQLHANALKAALAVECANEQGKFIEMHKKPLENQDKLSSEHLKLYSIQLDLDAVKFSACLDSNAYAAKINGDYDTAVRIDVKTAPTFVVNGKKLEGVPNFFELKALIDASI